MWRPAWGHIDGWRRWSPVGLLGLLADRLEHARARALRAQSPRSKRRPPAGACAARGIPVTVVDTASPLERVLGGCLPAAIT
ncbi:hypothetical protein, partial [Streptomyces sp. NRRL F-2305]|uniref:hypothetical protein n=1 Tax=Streptomyces sp. NRRL F-2305 TaxID=1463840 RepID=UPI001F322E80